MSSRASVAASSRVRHTEFEPQPQETPLNADAYRHLENLKKSGAQKDENKPVNLQQYLSKASDYINGIVGDINERAGELRTRRENRQQRSKETGEEEDVDFIQKQEDFQQKADELNTQMERSVRQLVDDTIWAQGVPKSIDHVIARSRRVGNEPQPERQGDEEDEHMPDADDVQPIPRRPNASENATSLLHAAESTARTQRDGLSPTERYSTHTIYDQFYRMKWDAQHPGENQPPVPNASTWFAHEEGRTVRGAQRGSQKATQENEDSDMEEDTEIQIASENISCKCPLTLQYFKDPVTSTKCPHSFERKAIQDLFRASNERVPLSEAQLAELDERIPRENRGRAQAEGQMRSRNRKQARCPERGCHQVLTESDLVSDIVLLKRTQRAQEAEKRAQEAEDDEDDEDSDDALPATQRRRRNIVPVGSSPTSARKSLANLKRETDLSMVPDSQTPRQNRSQGARRQQAMDINDMNDDENDLEDEDE